MRFEPVLRAVGTCAIVVAVVAAMLAQAPAFEVASVRPNREGGPSAMRPLPSGQFRATNMTLRELVRAAYALHDSQVVGGPSWITSERFDILARAEAPPPGGTRDVLLMLRALLAERFALRVRTEQREVPTYVLVRVNPDRLGPGIRRSTIDCARNPAPAVPNTAPLGPDGWPPCGLALVRTVVSTGANAGPSRTAVKQSAVSMTDLATRLQNAAGRPILDRTSLTGTFDIEYEYAPDLGGVLQRPLGDVPDLFTALEERLGLKLESQRNAVDVLVIDGVERPTSN